MSASCACWPDTSFPGGIIWSVTAASAQGVGAIAGTVTDASGAVLPGATVTLTSARAPSAAIAKSCRTSAVRISFYGSYLAPTA